MYNLKLVIFIGLLLAFALSISRCENKEPFIDMGTRHVEFDIFGRVMYVDRMPPRWRGKYCCDIIPCPKDLADDVVCWECPSRVSEPQNE